MTKRISPAVFLLFLAPILGELVSGHQPPLEFFNPITFLLSALPYGFGALICRELKVRWRKGWLSLLLLAIAYGFYEEGLVVRSIFDPNWLELGSLAQYNFSYYLNWTYALVLIHFHIVVSIFAGIILAEVLYTEQRNQSWLSNKALIACSIGLALWLPAGWLMTSYQPPWILYLLTAVLIAGLGIAAYKVPAKPLAPVDRTAKPPIAFFLLGLVNTSITFIGVFMTPEWQFPPLPVTFISLVLFNLLTLWLIISWSGNTYNWDDRHRVALFSGFLSFFIVFGFLQDAEQYMGRSLVSIVVIWALWKLWRLVNGRFAGPSLASTTPTQPEL